MPETERRFFPLEVRESTEEGAKPKLYGTAIKYGDTCVLTPRLKEQFLPGAFGDLSKADVVLRHEHFTQGLARTGGGGLTLIDSQTELAIEAELPSTAAARDALELVKSNVLRGLSIEFVEARDRYHGHIRIVQSARLVGVALVERPAYGKSLMALEERAWKTGDIQWPIWL